MGLVRGGLSVAARAGWAPRSAALASFAVLMTTSGEQIAALRAVNSPDEAVQLSEPIAVTSRLAMRYRPVVRAHDGVLVGVEAIAHGQHPSRGAIAGRVLHAVARLRGRSVDLARWMVDEVGRDASRIAGLLAADEPFISLRVSPVELTDDDVRQALLGCLERAAVPDVLALELTHLGAASERMGLRRAVETLQDHGVLVGLDGFGRGELPRLESSWRLLDYVSLDPRVVARGARRGRQDRRLVEAVAAARAIGMPVIASGVEDGGWITTLSLIGVLHVRGPAVAPALSLDELEQWAARRQRRVG